MSSSSSFMCADYSGNLMAIAQQLIQQQQQQQHQSLTSFDDDDDITASFDSDDWMIIHSLVDPLDVQQPPPPPPPPPSSLPPLLTSLLDCARLADSDPTLASQSLAPILHLSSSDSGDPTHRLAFYFSHALLHRLNPSPSPYSSIHFNFDIDFDFDSSSSSYSSSEFVICYKALNDASPYSKFAHLTANQAILDSTSSSPLIHILDFAADPLGLQWPPFLLALSSLPSAKPSHIRISSIDSHTLPETRTRLLDFAAHLGLSFDFQVHDNPTTIQTDPNEAVAVNLTLGGSDSPDKIRRLLRIAKSLNPKVLTLVEYEPGLNRAGLAARFASALEYYWAVFESLEPAMGRASAERVRVERGLLGGRIRRAVVGPEGEKWAALVEGYGGFVRVGLSNYAVSQAKMLVWECGYSEKFTVVVDDEVAGVLTLAWEGLPLLTVSSWR